MALMKITSGFWLESNFLGNKMRLLSWLNGKSCAPSHCRHGLGHFLGQFGEMSDLLWVLETGIGI